MNDVTNDSIHAALTWNSSISWPLTLAAQQVRRPRELVMLSYSWEKTIPLQQFAPDEQCARDLLNSLTTTIFTYLNILLHVVKQGLKQVIRNPVGIDSSRMTCKREEMLETSTEVILGFVKNNWGYSRLSERTPCTTIKRKPLNGHLDLVPIRWTPL